MKNFFAIASLALFLSACGSEDDGLPSATTRTVGTGSNAISVTDVGTYSVSSILPATGSCKIPDIAMGLSAISVTLGGAGSAKIESFLPSPMKYLVANDNELICVLGILGGEYKPLDFSQVPLKGLTCQELVADVPSALQQMSVVPQNAGNSGDCCEIVQMTTGGYVQTLGVECDSETIISISGALCSREGEFMGWACLI